MAVVTWSLRVVIFLFLFAFSVKNLEPVTLRFLFDLSWDLPLIALVAGFFAVGALFGLLAVSGRLVGLRREVSRLQREIDRAADRPAG
jgi:uncharacterized integral membrane protein